MNKEKLINMVSSHRGFFRFSTNIYNCLNLKNKLCVKGCKVSKGISFINGLKIFSYGVNNEVFIGDFVVIKGSKIVIHGSNNKVSIMSKASLNNVELYMEDSGNEILIGEGSTLFGRSHYAAIEGTKIKIGKDCLFSGEVHFRTGDSHSIVNLNGERINPSEDIFIDDHVWVGTKVTCLKGVHVSKDSVVAATTTLCKKYEESNVVIGGVPGKIIKRDVNWAKERL